uniref:AbiH family protein n=1 Tax=Acetatifactor sp. TaxID=1872090 RepID=UPI0040576F92
MNNILLVGNGFDLAHGLPTSYNDFLTIIKQWSFFKSKFDEINQGGSIDVDHPYYKYLIYADKMDKNNINKLGGIIQNNSWVNYYCKCEAEIDKWIDFEREIDPVMKMFEFIFNSNYNTAGQGGDFGEAHIDRSVFNPNVLRIARLWGKYINARGASSVCVKEPYASLQYGILKKKLMEELRKEFDEFIEAFELYLYEFVYKRDNVKLLNQIKQLEIESVISFNYTLTEKLYGIKDDNVHHIHGMIREEINSGKNNMVMGVNEQENQNMDFIYFVKYFQRIQKGSGVRYKSFVRSKVKNNSGIVQKEKYNLYIYGHSLDETDEDILKYVIGDKTETGKLKLNPKQVIIFYYDSADFEQKVINLIKLYGRPIVEEYMEKELFKFEQTKAD